MPMNEWAFMYAVLKLLQINLLSCFAFTLISGYLIIFNVAVRKAHHHHHHNFSYTHCWKFSVLWWQHQNWREISSCIIIVYTPRNLQLCHRTSIYLLESFLQLIFAVSFAHFLRHHLQKFIKFNHAIIILIDIINHVTKFSFWNEREWDKIAMKIN